MLYWIIFLIKKCPLFKSSSRLKLLELRYLLLIILAFPLLNTVADTWWDLSKCLLNWIAQSVCPGQKSTGLWHNITGLSWDMDESIEPILSRAGKYSEHRWLPEPRKASLINVGCLRTFLSGVLQTINWWELAIKMKHFSHGRYIPTPLLRREN